ncbi:MAG: hypothetical protein U0797_28970 [Gemmataceae bacterium]
MRRLPHERLHSRALSTSPGQGELALYLPQGREHGLHLCLDWCPRLPARQHRGRGEGSAELWADLQRSGVGRFSRRADLAALALLFAFGAFANAAGMIAPVVEWQDGLREALGFSSTWPVVTGFYLLALAVPTAVLLRVPRQMVYCLVPIGAAMWLSHYSFHFFTSYDAVVPAARRAAFDLGWLVDPPSWVCHCCVAVPGWLVRAEFVALGCGMLLSLYTAWRAGGRRFSVTLPWAALIVELYALGVWILIEPMQMRGTLQ